MINLLFPILIVLLMSGCHRHEPIIVIRKDKLSIPNEILSKTELPKPPSIELFKISNTTERMILLKDYMKELMYAVKISNDKIEKIKQINDQHE